MAERKGSPDKSPRVYRTRKDTAFYTFVGGLIAFGFKLGVDIVKDIDKGTGANPVPSTVSRDIGNELKLHISTELKSRDKVYDDKFKDIKDDIRELRTIVLTNNRGGK